ncbi:MAG: excinuclease ABC subunit UvrA [Armatimonadetes bacterium]|nr:excinuclease ABC subunit UvrA [Armatimonadota bacterium]
MARCGVSEVGRIIITGAREHNLRSVDLELPRDRLIVFTGVSGSGKSSLAFDTIYAEGQRRYIESLSAGARQHMGQLKRPDVDRIEGLSPAIAIGQKTSDSNPRSTVATVSEIYDYLRVLYARLGGIVCCGQPVGRQTTEEMTERLLALPPRSRVQLLAPVARLRKGEFQDVFDDARRAGFVRVRVDGEVLDLSERIELDRQRRHDIEIVVDRLVIKPEIRTRLADSLDLGLRHGEGTVIANIIGPDDDESGSRDLFFSRDFSCPRCGTSYQEPSPQLFSFNSPQGMCPSCQGLGAKAALDVTLAVPDDSLSLADGAVAPWGVPSTLRLRHQLDGLAKHYDFSLKTPWRDLSEDVRQVVLHGSDQSIHFVYRSHSGKRYPYEGTWGGVLGTLGNTEDAFDEEETRGRAGSWLTTVPCEECAGERLCSEARRVEVEGVNISELCARTISGAAEFFDDLRLLGQRALIGEDLVREIRGRLNFLLNVGLHYLSLDRPAPTLSGGEAQRIRLASQIGAGLVGVTYVLDEPSIGLHHRDNRHLLSTLQRLRDLGNTVIVVEHDEETMLAADYLVDVGPGPGRLGGEVVAAGSPEVVCANLHSLTADYLTGRRAIAKPESRRAVDPERQLVIRGAQQNNLLDIDVAFPLGVFVCVTGVSGSGKSSLVNDILHDALARDLNGAQCHPGRHRSIEGIEHLDKVIAIDQSPIGRTPRSNPATYTKVLDPIRQLYAKLPDAKIRGYGPGRFSFNVPGGRCEACEGRGYLRIEMDFLDDVWVECEVCGGTRFNLETLQVKFKGKSIADLLGMAVAEALELFSDVPAVAKILRTLCDVGLDYIHLGQPAPTLSGGEAQRIKLARELARRSTGKTLYLLDEPTTGLHFEDIRKLLGVLQRFVDEGNTVVVIEHNLDVIKTADYLIDMGPEGGGGGGLLIAAGTPEAVAEVDASHTGHSLREVLGLEVRHAMRATPGVEDAEHRISPWAPLDSVVVKGARAHNLKNIDAEIPRGKLTVLTGVSGSGKSSLALDTIYAEGQRRYVESLSSYARQFIRQLEKPPVDFVSGLSPAVSIEQRPGSRNPRSTVGTVTEVHDYLRLIWARLGTRHCVDCGGLVGRQTADEMTARLTALPEGARILVAAPLQLAKNEEYVDAFARLARDGFLRVRVNGEVRELGEEISIDRRRRHRVEVVVDRLVLRGEERTRLAEAVEQAITQGDGQMIVEVLPGSEALGVRAGDILFSTRWTCADCGRAYDELGPQHFSFNSPLGWCPECEGLGTRQGIVPDLLVAAADQPLGAAAIPLLPMVLRKRAVRIAMEGAAKLRGWPTDQPLDTWPPEALAELLFGCEAPVPYVTDAGAKTTVHHTGLVPLLQALYDGGAYVEEINAVRGDLPCDVCQGARLRPEAAAVRFRDQSLQQLEERPLAAALAFAESLVLSEREQLIAVEPLRETVRRLRFLNDVGLSYLTLARGSGTLSGGEAMRIRLASQIGSGLTGVLYILDEPTIGLHQRDNARLLDALERLRDLGNTVLMVEHDPEAIRRGDHVLDFGPGAGALGGRIVATGTPDNLVGDGASLTADYLSGRRAIEVPKRRRAGSGRQLSVLGARHHNLRNVDMHLPLGTLTAVTGVSGSGKSSLVVDILYPALARALHRARQPVGTHTSLEGLEFVDKVISIDQRPIGDNPRSNSASYVGVFDLMRELYATRPEGRARGYTDARFSFNRPGGRCETCWGFGSRKVEMHFLADVWVPCESCGGHRYNAEALAITFKERSIADVLEMTVDEGLAHFGDIPRIRRALSTLSDVGLGYVQLGQSALTLSGGEAQRVKLARELSRPSTGSTLYVLDEPTTGLHFEDVRRLLTVLDRLVNAGNTVVVIEHNLDVIKYADHVIDLGPEGGDGGGLLIAAGSPEQIANTPGSYTGQALAAVLEPKREVMVEATTPVLDVIADPQERWHRRQLAFSQQADAVWRESDLTSLLALVRSVDAKVNAPEWGNKEFVSLGIEGVRRWWARIRTSRPDCLRLVVRTASGRQSEAALARRLGLLPWELQDPTKSRRGPRVTVKRESNEDLVAFDLVSATEWSQPVWVEVLGELLQAFLEDDR